MADSPQDQPATFGCTVLTPTGTVFEGEVGSLQLKTWGGAVEILPRHEPLMAPLAVGVMVVRAAEEEHRFAVHGGFLSMNGEAATILADTAEKGEAIDVERAQEALRRAKERLATVSGRAEDVEIDPDRAKLAILRAMTRLEAAEANPRVN